MAKLYHKKKYTGAKTQRQEAVKKQKHAKAKKAS